MISGCNESLSVKNRQKQGRARTRGRYPAFHTSIHPASGGCGALRRDKFRGGLQAVAGADVFAPGGVGGIGGVVAGDELLGGDAPEARNVAEDGVPGVDDGVARL